MAYGYVDERGLVDVNANKVVKPGLCSRDSIAGNGRLVHEALDRVGVCDLLFIAQGQPFLADSCVGAIAARV